MARQMIRWWKNGDHPKDDSEQLTNTEIVELQNSGQQVRSFLTEGKIVGFFVHPDQLLSEIDTICGQPWLAHGDVKGQVVHPGDYVSLTGSGGYKVEHPDPMADALAGVEADGEVPPEAQNLPVEVERPDQDLK